MPVDAREIVNLLSNLAEEEQLKVTLKHCVRSGVIAGVLTTVGGLVGGPLGFAVGGTVGGCIAAATSEEFLSVPQVIANMESSKKELLAEEVRQIMNSFDVSDIAVLAAMIAGNDTIKNKVLGALITHLQTEMNLAIVNH